MNCGFSTHPNLLPHSGKQKLLPNPFGVTKWFPTGPHIERSTDFSSILHPLMKYSLSLASGPGLGRLSLESPAFELGRQNKRVAEGKVAIHYLTQALLMVSQSPLRRGGVNKHPLSVEVRRAPAMPVPRRGSLSWCRPLRRATEWGAPPSGQECRDSVLESASNTAFADSELLFSSLSGRE